LERDLGVSENFLGQYRRLDLRKWQDVVQSAAQDESHISTAHTTFYFADVLDITVYKVDSIRTNLFYVRRYRMFSRQCLR